MKKVFLFIIFALFLCFLLAGDISAHPGAIWTTRSDCGNSSQDVNQYARGEQVFIDGSGFNPGNYTWIVRGLNKGASCDPGVIVANGTFLVSSSGSFCFDAYTVNLDDCGEYKIDFGTKRDNYRVDLDSPVVPEFGVAMGVLTVLSAIGAFFVIRRR